MADRRSNLAKPAVLPWIGLLWLSSVGVLVESAHAQEAAVAVAANFLEPMRALEVEFEASSGSDISIIAGSTGQLYAQIINGAPFDVFLAADAKRPAMLAQRDWGDPASRFTYAIGRLALWSHDPGLVTESSLTMLPEIEFRWLAIAEPAVAPYGAAAKQTLERLGSWSAIESRIVRGQSIAQAFALTETGNADLGLIALSQALSYEGGASYAVVPDTLHDPIRQDAILLRRGLGNPVAAKFLAFLKTARAAAIIERYGYIAESPAN